MSLWLTGFQSAVLFLNLLHHVQELLCNLVPSQPTYSPSNPRTSCVWAQDVSGCDGLYYTYRENSKNSKQPLCTFQSIIHAWTKPKKNSKRVWAKTLQPLLGVLVVQGHRWIKPFDQVCNNHELVKFFSGFGGQGIHIHYSTWWGSFLWCSERWVGLTTLTLEHDLLQRQRDQLSHHTIFTLKSTDP